MMEGYTEMEAYPQRVSAALVSSDSSLRDSTEVSSNARTALHGLDVPVIAVTTAASSFVSNDVDIPGYQGSSSVRYSTHLSEVPTTAYAAEQSRYPSHLPPTSAISAYDPRSYTYNPGGFPVQQQHEISLSYGALSQQYISQAHHESFRTDSETYNAALALVQSQNKIYTDESGGQYFQLETNTADSPNYKVQVIHTHLVDNSTQNVSTDTEAGHIEKVTYVSEKPRLEVVGGEHSGTLVTDDRTGPDLSKQQVQNEVVIETAELTDVQSNPGVLCGKTVVLYRAESIEAVNSHVTAQAQGSDKIVHKFSDTNEDELHKQTSVSNENVTGNVEAIKRTVTKTDLRQKDTASQTDGPDLECRFGVLLEELKDTPVGKARCIKLKPVKCSDLEGQSVFFDIEVDNALHVSSIEKTWLSEKSSKYSFHISSHKDVERKSTSRKDNSDRSPVPVKSAEKSDVVTKDTVIKISVPVIKEEFDNKIMTRARKRKMPKPVKKQTSKKVHKSQSKKPRTELKINLKKKTKDKKPKSKVQPSKEQESSNHSDYDENDDISDIDYVSKENDYNATVDDVVDEATDFEAPSFDTSNNSNPVENMTEVEIKEEQIDKKAIGDNIKQSKKVKKQKTKAEKNIENEADVSLSGEIVETDEGESPEMKGKKRNVESSAEETKPKRKYTKRMCYNKTEMNYSVRKTETGKRIYTCPYCNRDFNQVGNCTEHMRTHTGEKPYNCPICQKAFSSRSNVNSHLLVHQTERNVVCTQCGFAFKDQRALNRHSRHHRNDRRWTCHLCGKSFYENGQLLAHLRIHTGEKPYKCIQCPKHFRERSSWVRHMDIHSGRTLHQCHVCGKGFSRKDNYVSHVKTHQNEKKTKCKMTFPSTTQLQKPSVGTNSEIPVRSEKVEFNNLANNERFYVMVADGNFASVDDMFQARPLRLPKPDSTTHYDHGDMFEARPLRLPKTESTTHYEQESSFNLIETGIENL